MSLSLCDWSSSLEKAADVGDSLLAGHVRTSGVHDQVYGDCNFHNIAQLRENLAEKNTAPASAQAGDSPNLKTEVSDSKTTSCTHLRWLAKMTTDKMKSPRLLPWVPTWPTGAVVPLLLLEAAEAPPRGHESRARLEYSTPSQDKFANTTWSANSMHMQAAPARFLTSASTAPSGKI